MRANMPKPVFLVRHSGVRRNPVESCVARDPYNDGQDAYPTEDWTPAYAGVTNPACANHSISQAIVPKVKAYGAGECGTLGKLFCEPETERIEQYIRPVGFYRREFEQRPCRLSLVVHSYRSLEAEQRSKERICGDGHQRSAWNLRCASPI